jgi:DNA topoisomerase-1
VVIKFGRNGEFLACTAYPDCDFTSNFTRDEAGTIVIVEPEPQERQKVGTCPECGQDLVLKKARTGSRFIACTGYPKCKYTQSYSTGVKCPKQDCPGELVEKSSKRGKVFYACNQYPDCKTAYWNWPIAEECPTCGSPILVRKETKARGEHVACPEKGCGYWRELRDNEKH